jgi:hypothetical protein
MIHELTSYPAPPFYRRATCLAAACGVAALLGACSTTETLTPVRSVAQPSIPAEALVGRWGLASYHRDTDRDRTLKEARSQCSNPYVIKAGANGGVVMNMADEAEPSELQVKSSADGRTFIGRAGPPGESTDMEVSAYDGKVLTIEYLDPDVTQRYGTMVYVKCDQAGAGPAKVKASGASG